MHKALPTAHAAQLRSRTRSSFSRQQYQYIRRNRFQGLWTITRYVEVIARVATRGMTPGTKQMRLGSMFHSSQPNETVLEYPAPWK